MTDDLAEVTATLHAVQLAFEELIVRGLESTGPDDVRRLEQIGEQLARAGAAYAAEVIGALVHRVREGADDSARALLRAQTAMRVFERVLSLDHAAAQLAGDREIAGTSDSGLRTTAGGEDPSGPLTEARSPQPEARLVPVLEELADLAEGLVASGLTTASAATKQKLDASFKEASRLKLLRLATSLRYVGDELARFLTESEHFSPRRLAFFLNRTWLISRGLLDAIAKDDRQALARLMLSSAPQPVKALTLAVVGVQKRALLDGSASFDFRMRVLADAPGVPRGTRIVWSCVFGGKKNVPAEAFLHLPQPQKFSPKLLLEPTQIAVTDAAVALDNTGSGRLMLGPKSTVTAQKRMTAWDDLFAWDRERAVQRIRRHHITPLDLEVELHEDVVLDEWELGAPRDHPQRKDQRVFPLRAADLELDAIVSTGRDGEALTGALDELRAKKRDRPKLFGVMHYEMGRLMFQPLTALDDDDGPRHLMISTDKIDLASLMKTLDFTT